MRKSQVVLVGLAVIMVAACSQNDPLQRPNKEVTARFLYKAAQSAERSLQLSTDPNGATYANCMDKRQFVKAKTCQALYQKMLEYAKQNSDYKNLTMEELTKQESWVKLRDYFNNDSFNTL